MEVTVNYKGHEIKVTIPNEALEKLIKKNKNTGWLTGENWGLMDNDSVGWYISSVDDEPHHLTVSEDYALDFINKANFFTDKALSLDMNRYQTLDRKIRRRIAQICEPVDWDNHSVLKYSFHYNYQTKQLSILPWSSTRYPGCWYFDTAEHTQQIIDEFKDELIWYFTEFKDRVDG